MFMGSGIDWSWAWAIGLITFALGMACGIGAAQLLPGNRRRTQELKEKLSKLQEEFDSYHDNVGQHFQKTSELVQKMTESYRDVYDHLATGSQILCKTPLNTPSLDIPKRPTLEAATQGQTTDQGKPVAVAVEADTGERHEAESHTFLGDAPRVPTLDTEKEKNRDSSPTHQ